jgi:hypothetical protein
MRCSDGCGEWLTPDAIDEHRLPILWMPIEHEDREGAPTCACCDTAMRRSLGGAFHRCASHGVWFDGEERQRFVKALEATIAKLEAAASAFRASVDRRSIHRERSPEGT